MKSTPKSKIPLVKQGIELAFQKRLERERTRKAPPTEDAPKVVRLETLNIEN